MDSFVDTSGHLQLPYILHAIAQSVQDPRINSFSIYYIFVLLNSNWISFTKFTLKRKLPSGGFAYGILVKALIGLPLYDRKYLPINLFPFGSVTRKSFDVIVHTKPNVHEISKIIKIRWLILKNRSE